MSENIAAVMDDIGAALGTITGLRTFGFPPKSAQPPFAFPDMPESIDFDSSYQRGTDRVTLTVVVGVGDMVDRAAWSEIAEYAAGSGPRSVKAVLEAAGVGQSLRVTEAVFRPVSLAGNVYAGVLFTIDVAF